MDTDEPLWKHRLATKAVHAGQSPDPVTGASGPNIVTSNSFIARPGTSFSAETTVGDAPHLYSRWSNPTVAQLEKKLAMLEGAEGAVCFSTGMAACSGLLLRTLGRSDHLVISDVAYAGVLELVYGMFPRMGIEFTAVNTSDLEAIKKAIRPNTRLVYIETPSNPILRLADITAIAELAHVMGAKLAVDSTFSTPVATRPLEMGADFVIHSLSKYIGGHGDALGGVIAGRGAEIVGMRKDSLIHLGGALSPFNAWLILRGVATLPLRMAAHASGAMQVATFLQERRGIRRVIYPGLVSHPQHQLAKQQMKNYSGILTFQVDDGLAMARKLAERLSIFHYTVSLGHHRSLLFYLPTIDLMASSFHLEGNQLASYRDFAGDGIFRVSVGIEDPDDLCEDLDRALG